MAPRTIDFHTHIFGPDVVADRSDFLRRDSTFREIYKSPQAVLATSENLLSAMDDAGVTMSVACGFGWETQELCHTGNDAIINAVQRHPDRLVGFGTIAPRASLKTALEEIERLAAAGLRGLGEMRPDSSGFFDMAPEELGEIVGALRAHRMALLLHASEPVGHTYPGKGQATPARMESLLATFIDIPVILAHGGGGLPFYAYMPEVGETFKNVYVDTAALPYLYGPRVVRALADAIGMDRILFGTDYPLMLQKRVLSYLEEAGLTEEETRAVLTENAERLLASISDIAHSES